MAARFSNQFHVHCMDLRNHGDSPHASGMSYTQMAADVAHTCNTLGFESTLVIGHSMGGKTAMQLALDYPAMIEQLAVVDIGPRRYANHHDSIIEGLLALSNTVLESRKQADELLASFAPEPGIRAFLLKNIKRTENGQYAIRININEIADCYNEIAGRIGSSDQTVPPFEKPVLFIKGAESDYLSDADRAPIATLFSHPQLKTIAGAGHWPHSEKPDVTYKILSDFFAAD